MKTTEAGINLSEYKNKVFKGEWIRGRATNTIYQKNTNQSGYRICVMEWEHGNVSIKAIYGDGRSDNFKELGKSQLPNRSSQEAIEKAVIKLINKFF